MNRNTVVGFVSSIILVTLYTVAYVKTVSPLTMSFASTRSVSMTTFTSPVYLYGGPLSDTFFAPANWIDQRVRPNVWVNEKTPSPYRRRGWIDEEASSEAE